MDQLAPFLATALGGPFATEMTLLVGFVLLLNIRRLVHAAVRRA
jgi:hypothetical protein